MSSRTATPTELYVPTCGVFTNPVSKNSGKGICANRGGSFPIAHDASVLLKWQLVCPLNYENIQIFRLYLFIYYVAEDVLGATKDGSDLARTWRRTCWAPQRTGE